MALLRGRKEARPKGRRFGGIEMDKIKELVCADWADYRKRLESDIYRRGVFVSGEYLYRGQSSVNYKLETSFDRWYNGSKARRPAVSDQLLRAFGNECDGHPGISP